jgi:hypothetical protein
MTKKQNTSNRVGNYSRQAIETKYLMCTDRRGSRVKASCERGSITISYDDSASASTDGAHQAAVDALIAKFTREDAKEGRYRTEPSANPWNSPYVMGGTKAGYVAVFVPKVPKESAAFNAEELASALRRVVPWLGRMIADGAHNNTVAPKDAVGALVQAEAVLEKLQKKSAV